MEMSFRYYKIRINIRFFNSILRINGIFMPLFFLKSLPGEWKLSPKTFIQNKFFPSLVWPCWNPGRSECHLLDAGTWTFPDSIKILVLISHRMSSC